MPKVAPIERAVKSVLHVRSVSPLKDALFATAATFVELAKQAPDWTRLMPAGRMETRPHDARRPWQVDAEAATYERGAKSRASSRPAPLAAPVRAKLFIAP